ncbi:nucleotidyltransferase domain-containing protein [Pseudonocardia thermophila]|jgi:Nucleotidyltransferase domain.|uniref:nucleotidyltransferase domain-containing protein n=1 Tax=Pseudonocardia thermophila TaxID=1848 RepID=UPI00248E184F|nr:nucleotidyltransferase domain-containing protein [Pseudonocardia thermophila]
MDDAVFLDHVTERLAALPHVEAVALGGSRAQGTHRPDSDWDLAIYYRGPFDPQDLRDLGWPGEVSPIGGWGGGVYNGGAWLEIDGRHTDVHYRDLDVVEHEIAEARAGRVRIEHLLFHLAGIPTYLIVAEVAINRMLHGSLPVVDEYPAALRAAARRAWWQSAAMTLDYATGHAAHGRVAQVAGLVAQAATQAAHAVLAARGEWVTNEKTLLTRAGLRGVDELLAGLAPDPPRLTWVIGAARRLCADAVAAAAR